MYTRMPKCQQHRLIFKRFLQEKKKSGEKIRKTYNWFHHKSKHKSIQMHTKDAKIAATLINLQKIFAKIKK